MRHLNYSHLLYFWTVARAGSVTGAARELNLTQPAVSGGTPVTTITFDPPADGLMGLEFPSVADGRKKRPSPVRR